MKNEDTRRKTYSMVVAALLTALVVVLSFISTYIKFGPFSITLTLIPVIVGGILLGKKQGTILGALFGIIVFIFCVTGVDAGGFILFSASPFLCGLLCIGKGALAGFVPALVYHVLEKKNFGLAVVLAAVAAPIANTGTFLIGMRLFFFDTLTEWAGGTDILVYMITGLVGINFLVELFVNAVCSPAVITIVRVVSKNRGNTV